MLNFIKEKKISILVFLTLIAQAIIIRLKGSGAIDWKWLTVFIPIIVLIICFLAFIVGLLFYVTYLDKSDNA